MIILVLNCGSSSLKYQLLDMKNDEVYDLLAKGLVERIGMEGSTITHKVADKKIEKEIPLRKRGVAVALAFLLGIIGAHNYYLNHIYIFLPQEYFYLLIYHFLNNDLKHTHMY